MLMAGRYLRETSHSECIGKVKMGISNGPKSGKNSFFAQFMLIMGPQSTNYIKMIANNQIYRVEKGY